MADEKGKYAYNYLVSKGLSPMAAAGIIGNLHAESGLNTRIPGRADDKGSIGIAQWHSERKQGLYDFAKKQGANAYNLDTQLDYLVEELRSPAYKKALIGVSNAKTPDEAAVAFMNDFEKPAEWAKKQSVGQRVGMARSIFSGTPYQNVNYQEEKGEWRPEYGVDTSLNLPTNTGDYQTAPDIASKEDLEAEQAKAELLQKQKEKDFISEVQARQDQDSERRYQQEQVYQQQQQQNSGIDPSYYEMPQIVLPEYIAYQQPQFQVGGKYNPFDSYKTIKLLDKRKVSATTGKPIDPNRDLMGGNYSDEVIRFIIGAATKHGVDPYTALAIGLQETNLGRRDENIGHITGAQAMRHPEAESAEEDFVLAIKDKMAEAKRLGIKDEVTMIQTYNGLGTLYPETEKDYHGFTMKSIYGVPLPKEGINTRKNPLYGKRIIDLRDSIIKNNPEINNYIIKAKVNPAIPQFYKEGGQIPERYIHIDKINKNNSYYKQGGELKGRVECSNCGWSWNKSDSTKKDMYNCHKCGGQNTGRDLGYQEGGLIFEGNDDLSKRVLRPLEIKTRYFAEDIEKNLNNAMDYVGDKLIPYVLPKGLAKDTREKVFQRIRPISYPTVTTAINQFIRKPKRGPGRDAQGDYDVSEEAWRKALDLPTKSKYITESKYKPTIAKDKNAKYYALNNIIDSDKIVDYVKTNKGKKGDKYQMNSLVPYMKDYVNMTGGNEEVDPLQNFQISVGEDEKGKYAAIYDSYDFDKSKIANRLINPYEFYDRYYYKQNGGYQYPTFK